MNKKGFTLVEVIVSVVLVSIVLISLMATLLKLRSTYSDVNKNTDVLIYGSSLSRVINNDLMDKNGIRYSSCDVNGLSCDFILGNDEQRKLEIIEEEVDHGSESASSIGAKAVNHKTIKTTLKYTNTTKEKDNDENEIIYIRTLTREDYTDEKGVHTTDGYSFYSLVSNEMPQDENTENGDLIDIVTKVTISMYDGKDINDSTYNVTLYSAGKYDFSNYTGKRFRIEFDLNGADSASGVFGMDEIFGVGFYKQDSKVTAANRYRTIPIPKKNTLAFLGYYYGVQNGVETQIVDSMGNIVVSSRFFKESVLLPEETGEEPRTWVRAKWGQCEGPGYRLEDGVCKPNKFTMTLKPNGGTIAKAVYENVVYQSYVPSLTSKPQRAGYEFLGFFSSAVEEDKAYYDNRAEPVSVYDIQENADLTARWNMCLPNTYSTAEMLDCKNCPSGYSSNAGSEKIEKCYIVVTPGHYLLSQASLQTACSPGTYRDGNVTIYYPGSVTCNKCAPNTYQGASGATSCIPCDPGYESGEGASSCTPKTLKITLSTNGGSGGTTTLYQKYNTGWYSNAAATEAVSTITKPTRTGYTFNGYFTLPSGGTKIIDGNGNILANTNRTFVNNGELYAQWIAHKYVVQYNGNTNTGGTTVSSEHVYDVAKNLTANGFSKTGYTFAGWAKSSTGDVQYADKASVKNLTSTQNGTVNLYAKWNANPYTVVYYGNTNTGGSTASSSHTFDVAKNLTANGFTKTGYTFAGWATSASGEILYADKESVKNLTSTPGGTFNLYAKWSNNSYTVKYNGNGSTGGSTASSIHTYDENSYLNPNGFVRTGYTFAGWATSASGSVAYADVAQIKNLATSGTFNLYAKWTANSYTVNYEGNEHNGGSTASSSHVYDVAKNLTKNGFTRNGYNFSGWASSPNGSKLYNDEESVKNLATSGIYMLYAKWTPKVLKITLNQNGGSGGTGTIYEKYNTGWYSNAAGTTSITSITKPSQTGKTYDGYFTLPTGGTKIIGEDGKIINGYATTFIEDGNLYSHWTTNTYTVVYNGNSNTGGNTSQSTHTYGISKALTKNGFTKTSYSFIGWATSASGNVVYTDEEVVKNLTASANGTVNLYAKWSQCTNGEGVHAWENGCTIATCAAGYYKDGNTCKYCSPGTTTTAGNTATSCSTCSNNTGVNEYTSLCTIKNCSAGYRKDGNACKACAAGSTTSNANVSTVCSECSNKTGVNSFSSLCTIANCKANYYKDGNVCKACAGGTTTANGNTASSCSACSNAEGVNSWDGLGCTIANCKAGYYKDGNACKPCAAGTYTDSTNTATSCTACPGGKTNTAGSTSCPTNCTNSTGVATWVNACKVNTCKANYYKNGNACTGCGGGKTTSEGNTSTSCSTCSNATGVASWSGNGCTVSTCNGGYYKNGNACSPCAAGTTTSQGNTSTSCSACTNSTGVNAYSSACIISTCKAGYYKNGNTCSQCAAGTYTDSVNSLTSCTACPGGKTNTAGSTSCPTNCSNSSGVKTWISSCTVSTCQANYYKNGNACSGCGGGKTTSDGNTSTSCSNCSNTSGVYSWSGNGCTVSTCNANFYKNGNACSGCGGGKTTSANNSSTSCSNCSNTSGVYSWSGNGCTVSTCNANYYKNGNACSGCSAGTTTSAGNASTSCSACSNRTGVYDWSSACNISRCTTNYYKSGNACYACGGGSFSSVGATSCTPCNRWVCENCNPYNSCSSVTWSSQNWIYYDSSCNRKWSGWVWTGASNYNPDNDAHWWFYFENGYMKTGWVKDGSYWYYLHDGPMNDGSGCKSGRMYQSGNAYTSSSVNWGGRTYYFDSQGRCTNNNYGC